MNDYTELHWAYDRFIEAINLVKDDYEKEFLDFLDIIISRTQLHTLPLLSCFSTDGDVLSQWRAYADDGAGVAIGFDSVMIKRLSVRFGAVTYDKAVQVGFFRDLLAATYPMWKLANTPEKRSSLKKILMVQTFDMCLMKNPAFAEEKEVRVARAVGVRHDKDGWHIEDSTGSGVDVVTQEPQPIKFRAKRGGLVAHIDLPISGLGANVIKSVVLGPRTLNSGTEVSMALNANGFAGSEIVHSTATYR